MKMDYTFPAPQPVEIKSFTVPSAVTGQIFLRSGFFDPQGNIFAYGFSTGDRGIFMRIAITNGTATKVSWHRFASDNTAIDDACWAYVNNQGTQICYGIIANNKFARVNFNAVTNMFIINPANIKYFSDKKLCSVVYDGQYFIVSGNDNNSMFYANILNSATLPSNVVGTTFIPSSTDIAFTVEANRIFQDGQDIYIIQPEKFQSSKSKVILLHKIIF
jgi:hypothetical protein